MKVYINTDESVCYIGDNFGENTQGLPVVDIDVTPAQKADYSNLYCKNGVLEVYVAPPPETPVDGNDEAPTGGESE